MFWTNWNEHKPSIMRSNLAGKNMRIIVGSDILTPNGLTVDHKAEKLYFSDGSLGKIERCDYDGSGRHVSRETRTLTAAVLLFWFLLSVQIFIRINIFIPWIVLIHARQPANDSLPCIYARSPNAEGSLITELLKRETHVQGRSLIIDLPFHSKRKQLFCALPFNFNPHWAPTIWPLCAQDSSGISPDVLSDKFPFRGDWWRRQSQESFPALMVELMKESVLFSKHSIKEE